MDQKPLFPKDFHWGAASSAFQVEGGIENMDWAQAAREGRVPLIGAACDHYHRYNEDFDLVKELGHNAYRFSVEWARIEPEEGVFSEDALEHYVEVLRALHVRGITPYVTLWHFTLPLWFSESGGWERKDAPQLFARYCGRVVQKLGPLSTHFATINEPVVYASNGWIRGIWPPFHIFSPIRGMGIIKPVLEKDEQPAKTLYTPRAYVRIRRALARAHNRAYHRIKAECPTAQVSIVKNVIVFEGGGNPVHRLMAFVMNYHWTFSFMRKVAKRCDEIGLNYYFYRRFGDTATYEKTDMHWDMVPEKIESALCILWRYKKPLYVAEAGLADAADSRRAAYIRGTVRGIGRALNRGVTVTGCMYWSLLDNYELAAGFEYRFGLIEVNYDTLERTVRPSAYVYKSIIEAHGTNLEDSV